MPDPKKKKSKAKAKKGKVFTTPQGKRHIALKKRADARDKKAAEIKKKIRKKK
tara:strand:+ start:29 stop:187 length:159 start_codon:yes stop_codon:yes gene_type:complete